MVRTDQYSARSSSDTSGRWRVGPSHWQVGPRSAASARRERKRSVGNRDRRDHTYDIHVRSRDGRLVVAVVGNVDVVAWRDLELMADAVAIADLDLDLDLSTLDF